MKLQVSDQFPQLPHFLVTVTVSACQIAFGATRYDVGDYVAFGVVNTI